MTQKAYPLDDTDYLAEDVRLFHVARSSGIFNATGTDLQVSANGRMAVDVKPGYAFLLTSKDGVGGITYGSNATEGLVVPTAESTTRYDYIAVRYSKDSNSCKLVCVKGSSAKPTAPVRTASVYEIILAILTVRTNASEIRASDIQDTRLDEKMCGLVVDGTDRIPTEGMQAQFTQFMNDSKSKFDEISKGIYPMENADIDEATA